MIKNSKECKPEGPVPEIGEEGNDINVKMMKYRIKLRDTASWISILLVQQVPSSQLLADSCANNDVRRTDGQHYVVPKLPYGRHHVPVFQPVDTTKQHTATTVRANLVCIISVTASYHPGLSLLSSFDGLYAYIGSVLFCLVLFGAVVIAVFLVALDSHS